tara:strand:+ start:86 stop:286 length:201 start_codon:yes stop_codon:yes gene_type:complete
MSLRYKQQATRHIEKLEMCQGRMKQMLEGWFGSNGSEAPINEALRLLQECERTTEYLNDVVNLEED